MEGRGGEGKEAGERVRCCISVCLLQTGACMHTCLLPAAIRCLLSWLYGLAAAAAGTAAAAGAATFAAVTVSFPLLLLLLPVLLLLPAGSLLQLLPLLLPLLLAAYRVGMVTSLGVALRASLRMRMRYCVIFVRRCLFLCTKNLGQYSRCWSSCSSACA